MTQKLRKLLIIDSQHTIELSDSDNEIYSEVVNQIIESTINITDEDTVENVTDMEYSNESDEDETSQIKQYFLLTVFSWMSCPQSSHW